MSLKKLFKSLEATTEPTVTQAQKELLKTLLSLCLTVSVACVACMAFMTKAWFANNDKVAAQNSSVSSAMGDVSLFITAGDVVGDSTRFDYGNSVEGAFTAADALYPISMQPTAGGAIGNWWYVSRWQNGLASEYTAVSTWTSAGSTSYTVDAVGEQKTYNAYNVANYTIYCTKDGTMDVYFDSEHPLTVTVTGDEGKQLLDALRIAFVVDGRILFVYSPVAESGTGNSTDASADTYYMVNSASSIAAVSYTVIDTAAGLTDYTASRADSTDPSSAYVADSGAGKLFTTDDEGVLVSLYVWLEGTDAQARIGQSDGASGISVSMNLAGIEVTD